jgi:hypothetical protein
MANFHTFKIIQSFIFLIGENKKLVHWTVAFMCLLWVILLPGLPWSLKLPVIFWLPISPRFFASLFYLKICYALLLSSSIFMSPSLLLPTHNKINFQQKYIPHHNTLLQLGSSFCASSPTCH